MRDDMAKLLSGALLHDIGKVIYRTGDGRNHSKSGYDYLKDEIGIQDMNVLESVLYHHAKNLKSADINDNSFAYIVYIADNIASAADRRKEEDGDYGFNPTLPLQPVFNILNGNNENKYYKGLLLNPDEGINYPADEKQELDESFYKEVIGNITKNLHGISNGEWCADSIDSLIEVMEANLSYVPSSTKTDEKCDISLFDHVKLTAAFSSCIHRYLEENGITDYKKELLEKENSFFNEKAFCMYSADLSGIQDFIYTITSKDALKMLRARSFYLEILLEHIMDELLFKFGFSRANIIYAGGGHCYMLLPNTEKSRDTVLSHAKEVNDWLKENFGVKLFMADGLYSCSANDLRNDPCGSYEDIFKQLGKRISVKKNNRYTAKEIISLNKIHIKDRTRECKVCRQTGEVNDEGECKICSSIKKLSSVVLYKDFFVVTSEDSGECVTLPFGRFLRSASEEELRRVISEDPSYVRAYGKNKQCTGIRISTKLWVGDYTTGDTFSEFAKKAKGIERIGVFRADVDNMGAAIVSGLKENNGGTFETLSRTATLSRQLSLFFKAFINQLIKDVSYSPISGKREKTKATIVYSGGDDLFIVGSWNDIIELAVNINKHFAKFTEGTLTLSGGIGIFHDKYPISSMAREVSDLEDESKLYREEKNGRIKEKNAITLFGTDMGTYSWEVFEDKVLGEKFKVIKDFFDMSDEKGKSFLYKILELLRSSGQEKDSNASTKINVARYVYYISRLEPERKDDEEYGKKEEAFAKLKGALYEWMLKEEDKSELITALYLYIYSIREKTQEVQIDGNN